MKKLFLLIIASWATSCLPLAGLPKFAAPAQTKSSKNLNENEIVQENQTLKKENQLSKSCNGGRLSGMIALTVPLYCAAFAGLTFASVNFVAVGFTTVAVCSLVQDRYMKSDNDKNKITLKERMTEHAKGIASVAVLGGLAGFGGIKLAKKHGARAKAP